MQAALRVGGGLGDGLDALVLEGIVAQVEARELGPRARRERERARVADGVRVEVDLLKIGEAQGGSWEIMGA